MLRGATSRRSRRLLVTAAAATAPIRGDYASLAPADLDFFREALGEANVVTEPSRLERYNVDWLGKWRGSSGVALLPASTVQVSAVLGYCNERRLAVVPQGGNTGLVGGSVPLFDEVVLSTSRMSAIRAFDAVGGVVTCEAGTILQALEEYANERGCVVPLDLGAKGSCTIGGNCATNAGGIRLLRYGSLHGSVLGIEAVLADGRVLDTLSSMRKDNTGFDLKQLLIGSEGALGVITAVSMQLPTAPSAQNVALLACASFDDVLGTLAAAKSHLSEILSAFEFLDADAMGVTLQHGHGLASPFEAPAPFYCLIETAGSSQEHDRDKLFAFLDAATEGELAADGVVAESAAQAAALWALRESTTEALTKVGHPVFKYDLSLPPSSFYAMVEDARARVCAALPDAAVVGFGHVGDGNLHLNVVLPGARRGEARAEEVEQLEALLEPWAYEYVMERGGSVSAEHGLGSMKAHLLEPVNGPVAAGLMRQVKDVFDPRGILNPGKMLG